MFRALAVSGEAACSESGATVRVQQDAYAAVSISVSRVLLPAVVAWVQAGVVSRTVNSDPIGVADAATVVAVWTHRKRTDNFQPSMFAP